MTSRDLDKDGRMPMSNKEYHSFQMLTGFADSFDQEIDRLEARAKLAGKWVWRDMKMLRTVSHKVGQAMFNTIPVKKQALVQAEIKRMVAGVIIRPPMNLPMHEPTNYTTVPIKSLEWLIDQILQWECLLCDKQGKEQKTCPFREKLESMYVFDIPDIKRGECPFQTIERYTRIIGEDEKSDHGL